MSNYIPFYANVITRNLLQNKYKDLKSGLQLRLTCDSYAQVIAVTIKYTLQLRSMTYFLFWQLRWIRRNFLPPKSAISDHAVAVSHAEKIDPMTLRGCNIGGERGAYWHNQRLSELYHVGRPPFWLIVTALDRNGYLPVLSQGDVRRRFAKFIVNMFFFLSLCLSATLRKIGFTDFNQIFSIDPTWNKEESAKFWGCYN